MWQPKNPLFMAEHQRVMPETASPPVLWKGMARQREMFVFLEKGLLFGQAIFFS